MRRWIAAVRRGALVLALGAWTLVACVGAPPELPEDRFYRLPEPKPRTAIAPYAGTIAVSLPHSDGLHTERALLYSHHDRPLEVLRHHYFFWAESPPRLLQDHMVAYLRAAGMAERVSRAQNADGDALHLESRLLRFERHIGGAQTQVVVELELGWNGADAGSLRSRRIYGVQTAAEDDSIYASVQAYGRALEQIYQRFLQELPPG